MQILEFLRYRNSSVGCNGREIERQTGKENKSELGKGEVCG
jgi:hypothetical protein